MRSSCSFVALSLAIALAACADASLAPTASEPQARSASLLPLGGSGGEVELIRPKLDVTNWVNLTTLQSPNLLIPAAPEGIGPGSPLLITFPGEDSFICSANFVWRDGTSLYLGAAGHCFVPGTAKATHGPGADYDASGVTVDVCVLGCEWNLDTSTLRGTLVRLGRVAYGRQMDATGTQEVGYDFGVVEIPAEAAQLVRAGMPVWGGFAGVEEMEFGQLACHYGNGAGTGDTFLTKARMGVGGGSDAFMWYGDFTAGIGDSGSGVIGCELDGLRFSGTRAIGLLTHLAVETGEVEFNGIETRVEHGLAVGTPVARAIELAREAGLNLALVEP